MVHTMTDVTGNADSIVGCIMKTIDLEKLKKMEEGMTSDIINKKHHLLQAPQCAKMFYFWYMVVLGKVELNP